MKYIYVYILVIFSIVFGLIYTLAPYAAKYIRTEVFTTPIFINEQELQEYINSHDIPRGKKIILMYEDD